MQKPVFIKVARPLSVLHRWLGVTVGLVVLLWFITGSVLSFVPFPALSSAQRIAASEVIDLQRVAITPQQAFASLGEVFVEHLRLISVLGQPRYVVSLPGQPVMAVSAADGQVMPAMTVTQARVIAEQFSGLKVRAASAAFDFDQWTVHGAYQAWRPFYRLSMNDAAGTDLYVSARSGEVRQQTQRSQRAWNYVGAVVHWINPTLLRKDYSVWRRVVWVLALAVMLLAVLGLVLGVLRTFNHRRMRRSGVSPFTGWQGWHHRLGLCAGVLLLGWITSGWLSLDIGTFFSSDQPGVARIERWRGQSPLQASGSLPLAMLQTTGPVREIEFTAIAGQPLLLLRGGSESSQVMLMNEQHVWRRENAVPDALLKAAVEHAWSPLQVMSLQHIAADDAYSLRINPLPLTTRRVILSGASEIWVHVDAATGQIISVFDTSRRIYRWLVDGLHTFDFPWLNRAGPLWHVLLLLGTTTGVVFSVTGVVLAMKRLRRTFWQAS